MHNAPGGKSNFSLGWEENAQPKEDKKKKEDEKEEEEHKFEFVYKKP